MIPAEPRTHAEASRQRRDIVSGAVMDEAALIRFVASPDGAVTPDLARKLPGRGLWVAATRDAVDTAARKGLFSRAAKAKLTAPADLPETVEAQLERRCLEQLGLARRSGALISGFEKARAAVRSGKAAWLVEASDGSADGRDKLLGAMHGSPAPPQLCGCFTAEQLSVSTGGEVVIHCVLLAGRTADRWTEEVRKLAGFRPLLPPSWRGEDPAGVR